MANKQTAQRRGMILGAVLAVAGFMLWKLFARLAWVNGNYTLTVPCQQWYDGMYESLPTRMTCVAEKSIWNYSPDFLSREWNQTQLTGAIAVAALYALVRCAIWLICHVGRDALNLASDQRSRWSTPVEDRQN